MEQWFKDLCLGSNFTILQQKVSFDVCHKFTEWMKPRHVTIQMKAIEQYFHVVLFIMLCKVALIVSLWIKP